MGGGGGGHKLVKIIGGENLTANSANKMNKILMHTCIVYVLSWFN